MLKTPYAKKISALCSATSIKCVFDDVKLLDCVVRTDSQIRKQPDVIRKFFERAGLLCAYADLSRPLPSDKFNSGLFLQYLRLPKVTFGYVCEVLSVQNLTCARLHTANFPLELLDHQLQNLTAKTSASRGFGYFYHFVACGGK